VVRVENVDRHYEYAQGSGEPKSLDCIIDTPVSGGVTTKASNHCGKIGDNRVGAPEL